MGKACLLSRGLQGCISLCWGAPYSRHRPHSQLLKRQGKKRMSLFFNVLVTGIIKERCVVKYERYEMT